MSVKSSEKYHQLVVEMTDHAAFAVAEFGILPDEELADLVACHTLDNGDHGWCSHATALELARGLVAGEREDTEPRISAANVEAANGARESVPPLAFAVGVVTPTGGSSQRVVHNQVHPEMRDIDVLIGGMRLQVTCRRPCELERGQARRVSQNPRGMLVGYHVCCPRCGYVTVAEATSHR